MKFNYFTKVFCLLIHLGFGVDTIPVYLLEKNGNLCFFMKFNYFTKVFCLLIHLGFGVDTIPVYLKKPRNLCIFMKFNYFTKVFCLLIHLCFGVDTIPVYLQEKTGICVLPSNTLLFWGRYYSYEIQFSCLIAPVCDYISLHKDSAKEVGLGVGTYECSRLDIEWIA